MKALTPRLKDAEAEVAVEAVTVVAMEGHATLDQGREMEDPTDREVISIVVKKTISLMEILMPLQVKEATATVKVVVFHAETTIKFNQNLKIFFCISTFKKLKDFKQ
jgi:hypothetical protein